MVTAKQKPKIMKLATLASLRQGQSVALAKKWLWNKIRGIRKATGTQMEPGMMVMFYYDAKWKQVLPHWDAFPLSMIVDVQDNGFTGLNFHYLPPALRWILLDKLLAFANDDRMLITTRLRLSYSLLASTQKYKEFRPCFKKYLYSHVQSKFIQINPMEWDMAIALPTAQFHGAIPSEVWSHSRTKI